MVSIYLMVFGGADRICRAAGIGELRIAVNLPMIRMTLQFRTRSWRWHTVLA